ncbi:MAG: nucleoside triphosphate pyrophosphohydrolase [Candidatus Omnitrophota bacterium]|jgi:tetrapyrrole methylase family protein/MazG family protein|nr:MAG: nucleoside triphosphate pyrophosphohydrolase [Candidatus Omnitrophota bacterium]
MEKTSDPVADRFVDLVEIMATLRSENGCPWDREQTHQSLKKYMIEEAYELVESVDENDDQALIEECGDVMLQVVFHARIGEEERRFSIADVLDKICTKLISRHPHVFGDRSAHSAEDVLRNWESDKTKEKPERKSILEGIPNTLPALMQACQIQERASRVGFDWEKIDDVFDKFEEEWREFRQARLDRNQKEMELEFGDILFALVNISRFIQTDPEEALKRTNQKFKKRFLHIEHTLRERNQSLEEASMQEMDALWEEAKLFEE